MNPQAEGAMTSSRSFMSEVLQRLRWGRSMTEHKGFMGLQGGGGTSCSSSRMKVWGGSEPHEDPCVTWLMKP